MIAESGSDAISDCADAAEQHGRLTGEEYVCSDLKYNFDVMVANIIAPAAHVGAAATELAIFGSLDESHRFTQLRNGAHGMDIIIPKVRTMQNVEDGGTLDINRYSSRIINFRALLARVIGLDELPQWTLVASGEMSLVGPRPLLQESVDKFSRLAEEGGLPDEAIDEWRHFLDVARPGIFGESQAMRHRRGFEEYTPQASVAILISDLRYMHSASLPLDLRTIVAATMTTVIEGVKSVAVLR